MSVERYVERTPTSAALHERARLSMPGGDTRTVISFTPHPVYMDDAAGCWLTDVDGNRYLDVLGNYTSMIHGHAHPAIVEAVATQVRRGTGHAGASVAALELAELLVDRVAGLDAVRFCNSGTEATLNALRAARAFTGRDPVLKFEGGYHGSHDLVEISVAPPVAEAGPADEPTPVPEEPGIPEAVIADVAVAPFNDLAATEAVARRVRPAAIIVEPMLGATGTIPPADDFLAGLRTLADELESVLIFDEVISFRLAFGGAEDWTGVRADLTTFGKIIGGGLPVGAFGGRADIMEMYAPPNPTLVQSGTFNANPLTMAAGTAGMRLLDRDAIDRLAALGRRFADGLEKAVADSGIPATLTGSGSLWTLHFTDG
ncbi:MAG: aspartate aminotransferase family protein, partial [Acidimicrobiia bacterium]|nr:aspartate aminotransferase family protein [Acidimicrobiia bacterium]